MPTSPQGAAARTSSSPSGRKCSRHTLAGGIDGHRPRHDPASTCEYRRHPRDTREDAQRCVRQLADDHADSTHPQPPHRQVA
jgi:hypothetical protein